MKYTPKPEEEVEAFQLKALVVVEEGSSRKEGRKGDWMLITTSGVIFFMNDKDFKSKYQIKPAYITPSWPYYNNWPYKKYETPYWQIGGNRFYNSNEVTQSSGEADTNVTYGSHTYTVKADNDVS